MLRESTRQDTNKGGDKEGEEEKQTFESRLWKRSVSSKIENLIEEAS